MNKVLILITLFLCGFSTAFAETWNMPYGETPISHEIYQLHMAAFYVCTVIGIIVFAVLIYSLLKFRKSKGVTAAHFHEHLGVEIIWTVIPFLILVALAIPATIVLYHIHDTKQSDLTVKVIGYQWRWKYEYLDQGISFFSNLSTTQDQINNRAKKTEWYLLEVDHPLVVPVNKKVKLLITADDVIHAWWVPALGIKQDAIPGYINENWIYVTKAGTYRGQCGELCGVNHGFMPIVVEAVSQADFDKWVVSQQTSLKIGEKKPIPPLSLDESLSLGKNEYEKSCAMCHQKNGEGLPPSFPALKGSAVVTGKIDANIVRVLHGVPGTAMQPFVNILDDKSLAAIITYTRHAWGNDKVNAENNQPIQVQPQEITAIREKS